MRLPYIRPFLSESGSWLSFLSRCAWGLGALLFASGLISWIAANWGHWPALFRLGLVQALLLLLLGAAWHLNRWGSRSHPDLAVSTVLSGLAAVCVGGLLALIGQVYQSGADPWQLFALWAILILPLTVMVRSLFLVLLQSMLLNVALFLYIQTLAHSLNEIDFVDDLGMVALNLGLFFLFRYFLRVSADRWQVLSRMAAFAVCVFLSLAFLWDRPWELALVFGLAFLAQRRWVRDVFIGLLCMLGLHAAVFVGLAHEIEFTALLVLLLATLVFWLYTWRRWRSPLSLDDATSSSITQQDMGPTLDQEKAVGLEQAERATLDPKPSSSSEPWFIRAFKLLFLLILAGASLLFMLFSLEVDTDVLGWIGGAMLLLSPVLVRAAQRAKRPHTDSAGVWLVLGMAFFTVSAFDDALPWTNQLTYVMAAVWSALLYYLLSLPFVIRFVLAGWGVLALFMLLNSGSLITYHAPTLQWLTIAAYLVALVLGHAIHRRPLDQLRWMPLFWVLLLIGLQGSRMFESSGLMWESTPKAFILFQYALSFLPVVVLYLYWPLRARSSAGQWLAFGGLLALCTAWMSYWPVISALCCLLVGRAWHRRSLIVVGLLCLLSSLAGLYYYMPLSLTYKAYVLLATGTGLALLASFGLSIDRPETSTAAVRERVHQRTRLSALLTLAAVLLVANGLIYQKENIVRHGQEMVLELAPVDPRSLMQGDYMSLSFTIFTHLDAMLNTMPKDMRESVEEHKQLSALLTPNEQGVFGVRGIQLPDAVQEQYYAQDARYANKDNWPDTAVRLTLRKERNWSLGTDAWFFPEGTSADFDRARYGRFKVGHRGEAVLTDMLDGDMQPIKGLRLELK